MDHLRVATKLLFQNEGTWNAIKQLSNRKRKRGWEKSRQLCKPSTSSQVCITVENSPNPSSVYIRIYKHRKKIFYCFYKITFPRKKAKLSCLEHWLKDKFIPVAKSCTRTGAHWWAPDTKQSLFCKKYAFQNTVFLSLKMSAQVKKNWHSMFLKIFQVSADEEMGE